jgi:dinuclear metal center YbgI/SA1388 family protein
MSAKWDFDNVGLLIGDGRRTVTKILVALDITPEVIAEADDLGANLIVSHHPVIRKQPALISITPHSSLRAFELVERKIAAICMHTNLDAAIEGVNSELAKKCGLPDAFNKFTEDGVGRVATLSQPTTMPEYLTFVKAALNVNALRYVDSGKPVHRVAVCGGSGGDYCDLEIMERVGFDTLVTSDVKYHAFLDAKEIGLNLIDADHFCTENVVVPLLQRWLTEQFPALEVHISAVHKQTVQIW